MVGVCVVLLEVKQVSGARGGRRGMRSSHTHCRIVKW
jgi:hypothetical protein